jgi:flagellar motor switch protein FliG
MPSDKQNTQPNPKKWMPPSRAVGADDSTPPDYPSYKGDFYDLNLAAILADEPEAAAARIADHLEKADDGESLSRLYAALGKRLEARPGGAAGDAAASNRLQELELIVQQLGEKLATMEKAASATPGSKPASVPTATAHEQLVDRVRETVLARLQSAAQLMRTMILECDTNAGDEDGAENEQVSALQKVPILCVGLGDEVYGELLKYLTDFEIDNITQAVAGLKFTATDQVDAILAEFEQRLLAGDWMSNGGVDFARVALERALGPRRAQEVLDRVSTRVTSGFYMLKNVAPDQIAPFISNEHPQTIGLVLSQLDPGQAAGILSQLPERMQQDVAFRIATMENITPNVIKEIEESLEQSLRDILGGNQDVGGPKVVADMLNLTGSSVEKNVLDAMDRQGPPVAESVRNLMFVFDDIHKLSDREIQVLLKEVDQKDLVVALKAATEVLKDKILGNLSEKVRTFITEEMEFLGPMRLSEVEEVQLRIVQQVRQLEEQGQLTIIRGDSDDSFV